MTTQPNRLSDLPPGLLLMITRCLPLQFADSCDDLCCRVFRAHRQFISHLHVLALSRTCRHLHDLLSPELLRGFLLTQEGDLLEFAVKRGYVDLGIRLLREGFGFVECTEERLVKYVQAKEVLLAGECWWGDARKQEDARRGAVEVLLEMGAGWGLGKEWHALMGLRWTRERAPSPSQPHPYLVRKQRVARVCINIGERARERVFAAVSTIKKRRIVP